jgi:hypothetical protein
MFFFHFREEIVQTFFFFKNHVTIYVFAKRIHIHNIKRHTYLRESLGENERFCSYLRKIRENIFTEQLRLINALVLFSA